MVDTAPQSTLALVKRLVCSYLKPDMGLLYVSVFFMAIAAALTAVVAKLFQPILDDVLVSGNESYIVPVGLAVCLTFVFRGGATYIHTVLLNKIGQSAVADIQKDLFNHFMTMDLAFFHANPSGQLLSRIINDVSVMRVAVADCLTGIGKSFLTLVFLIALMFYQDWKLALAALTIFPFAALFVAHIGKRLRKVSRSIQDQLGGMSDQLSQIFQGIRQVKAYNAEEYEKERAAGVIENVRDLSIRSAQIGNLSTPTNEILVGLTVFGIILYGGHHVASGDITAGQLGSFIAAFILAYEPMKRLARINNTLQTGLGATERVFAMLDQFAGIVDDENANTLDTNKPNISYNDVTFGYDGVGDDNAALKSVNFTMNVGQVTALVGPSGSGKSTILNLLPRFYDPNDGSISINGVNIREFSMESLRNHIALVSQDITIFDDTVHANIAYGRPDVAREDVIKAAKMAAAHDFIMEQSDGYETRLGENGVKLSGGQKQRIAIARAFLKDAPILLLDEATSALDTESEKLIQKTLSVLQEGRTTLVIAHRLSTIQNAHKIIVMENGRILETGTHHELIKRKGLYTRMVEQASVSSDIETDIS